MKRLIRKKLAPRLRVTVSPETTTPSPDGSSKKDNNYDAGNFQQDGHQLQDTTLATTNKLLLELLDLQRAQLRGKADEHHDPDKDKRNDWKLAAAVIDRILCIIFSILFAGGTVVFFVTFAIGYRPSYSRK